MFGKKKSEAGITLVANNCEMSGDIRFSDQLLVNGTVNGNIYAEAGSKALVTSSEKGRVSGDIRVPNVVVNGKVVGDIYSDKHVELSAKAEVIGNVYYSLIEMVMGSRVDGSLVHVKPGEKVRHDGGAKVAQAGSAGAKSVDPTNADASNADARSIAGKATEARSPEARGPEARSPEAKSPEARAADAKAAVKVSTGPAKPPSSMTETQSNSA